MALSHRRALFLALSVCLCRPWVLAQDPTAAVEDGTPPAAEWLGGAPWWQWSRATGDWGGHRTWLEEHGIEVGGGLTVDWGAPWSGGLRRRDSVMSLLDVNVAVDLDALLGLRDTLVFVDAYQIEGRDLGGDVGDFQGVSNIQTDDWREVAEAWIETSPCEQLRLKFGKVDFNSEFAFCEEGGEFVNSSAGISPSIVGAPTYPDPATAAIAFWTPCPTCYLGVGVFDGGGADGIRTGRHGLGGFFESQDSDAYFTVVEAGNSWTGGNTWGSGRAAIGGWYHGGRFTRFDGDTQRGTSGLYALLDQRVWRENPAAEDDAQGVGLMAMLGWADDDLAEVGLHAEVGVTWTGWLDGRDDDVLGLLLSHVDLSDDPSAGFADDETVVELMCRLQLTPSVVLKPDLQYVIEPNGDPTTSDAWVALLRLEITF